MENNNSHKQEYSIKHFAREAFQDFTHFDVKLTKTIKPLLFKPGYLTVKAFSAEQSTYVKPLALFVFLNFLFFLLKSRGLFQYALDAYQFESPFTHFIADAIAKSHLTPKIFAERFNTSMKFEEKEYLIVMVPLFALLIQLLYVFQKKNYVEHLVFSLHFYAFFLIYLTVVPVLFYLIKQVFDLMHKNAGFLQNESTTFLIIFPIFFIYLFFSMLVVYKQKILITIFKAVFATAGVAALILFVYRTLMFFVVLHSISE